MVLISNRRGSKRYKYQTIILHTDFLPGILYKAKLYNLSKTGIYFETNQSLYTREKIYITKKNAASNKDKENLYRIEIKRFKEDTKGLDPIEIQWRKQLKNSSCKYGYGAAFIVSNTNFEKLIDTAAFYKHKNDNGNLEYKKDPRVLARENYRKEIIFGLKNQTYTGVILNINRAGAFIATKYRLHLGQIIHLEIPGNGLFKDLKIKGLIVRKDSIGVGVKFDRRTGLERRNDLDRRQCPERRVRLKH